MVRAAQKRILSSVFGAVVLSGLFGMAGCGDDHEHGDDPDHGDGHHHHDAGPESPSGAECPQASTLTYDNFGREFMESYCTRCHSSERQGAERQNAPDDHDFDALEGIRVMLDHIDEHAAAGPDAVNTRMPPTDPRPTMEERERLGEWLACGAPE